MTIKNELIKELKKIQPTISDKEIENVYVLITKHAEILFDDELTQHLREVQELEKENKLLQKYKVDYMTQRRKARNRQAQAQNAVANSHKDTTIDDQVKTDVGAMIKHNKTVDDIGANEWDNSILSEI